ncbi:hypothetical protein CPC08DRAFT_75597 [Agrocybe pediades]|nr:hypothetical protein CPC08DRAFT_75597 [Agrocybe pediades]
MSVIIVDDRDPSITYSGTEFSWGLEENANEFDGTSTFCNVVGGTAKFSFSGPSTITVFGVIQAASAAASGRSTYSIDGGIPQTFLPSPLNNTAQFNVKFFESSVSSGSHNLVITTLDGDDQFVFLDYIQLQLPSSPSLTRQVLHNPRHLPRLLHSQLREVGLLVHLSRSRPRRHIQRLQLPVLYPAPQFKVYPKIPRALVALHPLVAAPFLIQLLQVLPQQAPHLLYLVGQHIISHSL